MANEHIIVISEKIKGDLYTGVIKDALRANKTVYLTEEQFNHPNIQALIDKGFATEKLVEVQKVKLVTQKVDDSPVQNAPEEHYNKMTTWDAEHKTLLTKDESKSKAMSNSNSAEAEAVVKKSDNDIIYVDLEESTSTTKKERPTFKKPSTGKKRGRPAKIASVNKDPKFVYENPGPEIQFVDEEQTMAELESRLKKRKLTKKEQQAKLKKYLIITDDEPTGNNNSVG